MREDRKVYKVSVGKRSFERPWRRWEDGIRMDIRQIGFGDVGFDWLSEGTGGGLL
jgi:hypothetical protein